MQLNFMLLLVHLAKCLDLEINGEVSFDLRILDLNSDNNKNDFQAMERKLKTETKNNKDTSVSIKMLRAVAMTANMTAAPIVECIYQYPEKEQVNAILSNMMNQLTKMFIRVHDILPEDNSRRKQEKRFRVISKKNTDFFENIYNNMTEEYRIFYNKTANRVDRSGRDPCQHQDEIKEMWRELLEKSVWTVRHAALQCVEEYLRVQNRNADIVSRRKLKEFLTLELRKMRSSQLDVLCDNFQLCFNDLL